MKLRFLHPTESPLIAPILAEHNTTPPAPFGSRIVVAQDQVGGLTGFAVLQPQIHLEPVWVTISERGSNLWEEMMRLQLDRLKLEGMKGDVFCFAPRPAIERLLETRLEFERLDWKVMRRSFGG